MRFLNVLFVLFFVSACATAEDAPSDAGAPGAQGGPIAQCPVLYSCTRQVCTASNGNPEYFNYRMNVGQDGTYTLRSAKFFMSYGQPSSSCQYKDMDNQNTMSTFPKPEYAHQMRPNLGSGNWSGDARTAADCWASGGVGCDFYINKDIPPS